MKEGRHGVKNESKGNMRVWDWKVCLFMSIGPKGQLTLEKYWLLLSHLWAADGRVNFEWKQKRTCECTVDVCIYRDNLLIKTHVKAELSDLSPVVIDTTNVVVLNYTHSSQSLPLQIKENPKDQRGFTVTFLWTVRLLASYETICIFPLSISLSIPVHADLQGLS